MVSYIFIVAAANLALGFMLAVHLGHRYRALESASLESFPSLADLPAGLADSGPPAPAAVPPAADARGHDAEPSMRGLQSEDASDTGLLTDADGSLVDAVAY